LGLFPFLYKEAPGNGLPSSSTTLPEIVVVFIAISTNLAPAVVETFFFKVNVRLFCDTLRNSYAQILLKIKTWFFLSSCLNASK